MAFVSTSCWATLRRLPRELGGRLGEWGFAGERERRESVDDGKNGERSSNSLDTLLGVSARY